ncbi:MAG TPA: tRNA-dihydrouridine synthase [Candidatus Paceibacterota bacterium]
MTTNFWKDLPKPFFALAPMADVTDAAFRRIIAKYSKWGGQDVIDREGKFTRPKATAVGGPDVMWTEFVSADGLVLAPEAGKKKILKDLEYSESERPIVAQLFGSRPENMEKAAALCASLGFDGVDINMGCPDKTIEKQKAGAAMIKNPELAREVILAAKRGAPHLPISVKTRLGYNKDEIETWLPHLLSCDLAAVVIHARTRKEMSSVPARWERIKRAVEIRDASGKDTLIIGNGDVEDLESGKLKVEETGCDGVMLGRGIFGNPWLFSGLHQRSDLKECLNVLIEHTKLFEELLGGIKNFSIMKKHYKAYVDGFSSAKELRMKLMEAKNAREVESIVQDFIKAI